MTSVNPDPRIIRIEFGNRFLPISSQTPLKTAPFEQNNSAVVLVTDWASEIRTLWAQGQGRTLELAKVLCAARQALPYGAWSKLWQSDQKMPFGKRKAEQFVVIGRGLSWADAHVRAHLPRGSGTLYYIAQFDRATLENLIARGLLHPRLTRKAARALLAEFNGRKPDRSSKINVRQRLQRFEHFVNSTVDQWSLPEALLGEAIVTGLSRRIAARVTVAVEQLTANKCDVARKILTL